MQGKRSAEARQGKASAQQSKAKQAPVKARKINQCHFLGKARRVLRQGNASQVPRI
jgi:hypothetical protein